MRVYLVPEARAPLIRGAGPGFLLHSFLQALIPG